MKDQIQKESQLYEQLKSVLLDIEMFCLDHKSVKLAPILHATRMTSAGREVTVIVNHELKTRHHRNVELMKEAERVAQEDIEKELLNQYEDEDEDDSEDFSDAEIDSDRPFKTLEEMNVSELRKLASAAGVKSYAKLKKDELIEALS